MNNPRHVKDITSISQKLNKSRLCEEIATFLRSLHEEQLREIVNSFFQSQGLYSDIVHGTSEHGKDIVVIVPKTIDVLGHNQVLIVQIKTGNISEGRWRNEIKLQFDDVLDHYIQHYEVDEKWPKRCVLILNGRLTEEAKKSIHDYNYKNRIPVEVIDLTQLAIRIVESGFYRKLLPSDTLGILRLDPTIFHAILGYMCGVSTSKESIGISFPELVKELKWLKEEQISQALDAMLDMGIIKPAMNIERDSMVQEVVERRYQVGEIITSIYQQGETQKDIISSLDKYKKDLNKFTDSLLKENPDYIIPITRKGMRTLQLISSSKNKLSDRLISYGQINHLGTKDLKNKKIILFDDVVETGTTLSHFADDLKSLGGQLKTSAFLAHNDCPKEKLPAYYFKKLSGEEYATEVAKIALAQALLSRPFEPGHLVIDISIMNFASDRFLTWLRSMGNLFLTTAASHYFGKQIFTLSNPNFYLSKDAFVPSFVSEEGTCKIRISIQNNEITCVPIVFPKVKIKHIEVTKCDGRKKWIFPFCEKLPIEWYRGNQADQCFACSDFHASVYLGGKFLSAIDSNLSNYQMNLVSWRIDEDQLSIYFRDKSKLLTPNVTKQLKLLLDDLK